MLLLWRGWIVFSFEYVVSFVFDDFAVRVEVDFETDSLEAGHATESGEVELLAVRVLADRGVVLPFREGFVLDTDLVNVRGGYAVENGSH
jgi:hypothetical protein